MITKTSIHALIKLMDDPDPMVVDHAMGKLLEYGEVIIPNLERLEDDCIVHPNQLQNISIVLDSLRFYRIKNDLIEWLNSEDKELLKAVFTICSYQFPDLTIEDFTFKFQELRHKSWMEINSRQTSFEKVSALNKVFFETFNFICVNKLPHSPFELFVNSVLDCKEGTDMSLGLIYSFIAQSLDIPIYGVTTMNERVPFVLAYMDKDNLLPLLDWGINNNGVLFYVNLSNKGLIIDPKQMKEAYLEEGLPQSRAQFEPSPNSVVIKRYLKEIKRSYENQPQFRYKLKDIEELLELFK